MARDGSELMIHGIDYTDAMDRFADNEELYYRLAVKFLDDPHFKELTKALGSGDIAHAQRAAHSLKGVAGNLSFSPLYRTACEINDALTSNNMDQAQALLPAAQIAYDRVCNALRKMST